MSNVYIPSLSTKHGDPDRVRSDCKALYQIIRRQGTSLLIDCIAEHVATVAADTCLNHDEVTRVTDSIVEELSEAIGERT